MKHAFLTAILLLGTAAGWTQTGCPGCSINLPDLTADTIYIDDAPGGEVGVYYETDLSFRLPMTTTPVNAIDSTTPPGIPISSFTVNGIFDLPPGLEWTASNTEFNVSDQTDGCVRFCGTPLQAGTYVAQVALTASVVIIEQETTIPIEIVIAPATQSNSGFAVTNDSGCGAVTAEFTNNNPSDGVEGYTYFWDFGNGQTSTEEMPGPQLYNEPGSYDVHYEAVIDTTGYFLTSIVVSSTECSDALGFAIDPYVEVIDPMGSVVFTSEVLTGTDPPVQFALNLALESSGSYQLNIWDEDSGLGGDDDLCGTIVFEREDGSVVFDSEGVLGGLTIFHPVDTIRASAVVTVFEQPQPPLIVASNSTDLCVGDSVLLMTDYDSNLQWYINDEPLVGANLPELMVNSVDTGFYQVVYISPEGCEATSGAVRINELSLPIEPVLSVDNNLITLENWTEYGSAEVIIWTQDGLQLDAVDEFCTNASGTFRVIVTNAAGCTSSAEVFVEYDEAFVDCTSDVEDPSFLTEMRIFPNPVHDQLRWETDPEFRPRALRVYGSDGRCVLRQAGTLVSSGTLWVDRLAPGTYILELIVPDQTRVRRRFVKF